MNKVSEYTLVTETGTNAFIKAVNEHIQNGWIPFGGVSSTFANITNPIVGALVAFDYSQAMVKY